MSYEPSAMNSEPLNAFTMFNYKRLIKRLIYYSGIPYLFVIILYFIGYCFRNTPGTVILCYHSINDLNNSKIFNPNIVDKENFLKQMKFLRKYYNVISLEYFVKNHKKLTCNRNIVITFDDGYKDNFTIAYPVLQKYKLPATIFLATDFISTGKAKFEDIITYLFSVNNVATIDLHSLHLKKTLNTKNEKDATLSKICYTLNKLDIRKSEEVINELCTKYNIESDRLNKVNDIMLTWDEIRNIDRKLITFGSHSISHQNLTKLSHNQQVNEVEKSKSVIEHKLKSSITGFSYPLGFFDNNVLKILKAAGYKYAITTIPGINNGDIDFFKLKRISAVNNFHLFKFYLICQSGTLYNIYSKLVRLLV